MMFIKRLFNSIFRRKKMEAILKEVIYKDGVLGTVWEGFPGIQLITTEMTRLFQKYEDAENYIEAVMTDSANFQQYVLTIQKRGKLTPHQKYEIEHMKNAELQTKIAELRKTWISVEDEFPHPHLPVLVCRLGLLKAPWIDSIEDDYHLWKRTRVEHYPTHWQHLPTPPEQP